MNEYRFKAAVAWVFRAAMLYNLILPVSVPAEPIENVLNRLARDMAPLDLNSLPKPSPEAMSYFRYYGINFKDAVHHFGYFESSGYRLAAHVFTPEDAKGTVYLQHGYLDHSGLMKNIIELLLGMDFSVAIYDLPGHGLSSGDRAAIGDFSEYTSVFKDFIRRVSPRLSEPQHLIGHSTGCTTIYDYLHQTAVHPFHRVIFLAPLVHSNHWWLSKAVYRLVDPFVDKIPRTFKENTSDPNYPAFLAADPLQSRSIPLRWVNAMFAWEDRVQGYAKIDQPVCMIQGDEDTVVDWRYNISFLHGKLDLLRVRIIPGAKHQLINERIDLRSKAFHEIRFYLVKSAERSP